MPHCSSFHAVLPPRGGGANTALMGIALLMPRPQPARGGSLAALAQPNLATMILGGGRTMLCGVLDLPVRPLEPLDAHALLYLS